MKQSEKPIIICGAILLACAAFFTISILLQFLSYPVSNTNVLSVFHIGEILFSVYGYTCILIPVYLFCSSILLFWADFSKKKAIYLATTIIPFYTIFAAERICKMILPNSTTPVYILKLSAVIFISGLLIAIEYLAVGLIYESICKLNSESKKTLSDNKQEPLSMKEEILVQDDEEVNQNSIEEIEVLNQDFDDEKNISSYSDSEFIGVKTRELESVDDKDDVKITTTDPSEFKDELIKVNFFKSKDEIFEPNESEENFLNDPFGEISETDLSDTEKTEYSDIETGEVNEFPPDDEETGEVNEILADDEETGEVNEFLADDEEADEVNEIDDDTVYEKDEMNQESVLQQSKINEDALQLDKFNEPLENDVIENTETDKDSDIEDIALQQDEENEHIVFEGVKSEISKLNTSEQSEDDTEFMSEEERMNMVLPLIDIPLGDENYQNENYQDKNYQNENDEDENDEVVFDDEIIDEDNDIENENKVIDPLFASANEQEINNPMIELSVPKRAKNQAYKIPSEGLLTTYPDGEYWIIDDDTKKAGELLKETLSEFHIQAEVTGIRKGPVITMFEILPAPGVKLGRIVSLQDNIALRLAASSVRIVAPIPGKSAVGIEVPNKERAIVSFKELIDADNPAYKKMAIPVVLGKDITGEIQLLDLAKTPHLLIAGSTGSGKSVCVNSMILSVLFKRSPNEVKMILIDPKVVELKLYNDIPHLLTPVITEPKKAFQALQYCLCEMERRYSLLDGMGVRDITSYNRRIIDRNIATEKLPYIVVVIDEFADLMATTGKELESTLARLAAMSRAVGIHLVLATQRPSIDVITGLIKANIPTRIAFMVASKTDSRIIIDQVGAEKLLGRGDMLYASATDPFPVRIQGTYVSDNEVENVVDYVKQFGEPEYIDEEIFVDDEEEGDVAPNLFGDGEDPLYNQALEVIIQAGKASASYIQRRLKIGYNRAARLVEEMEDRGIVGPANGSKPREIIHIP